MICRRVLCLSVYLLCCQCCLLLKHTQVQLHVLQSGSAVQRDSGLGVQQHPVLVHRRHIRRVIGGADELQAAQTEHQPGQHERHEEEHGVMWLGLRKRRGRIQRFIRRYPFHLKNATHPRLRSGIKGTSLFVFFPRKRTKYYFKI